MIGAVIVFVVHHDEVDMLCFLRNYWTSLQDTRLYFLQQSNFNRIFSAHIQFHVI